MKISQKLGLTALSMLALFALNGAVTLFSVQRMLGDVRQLVMVEEPLEEATLEMEINAGETAEFTVDIAKLGRDDIYSVNSLSNEFDAKLVSIQRNGADAEATVRITPAAGHHGLLYGTIEFLSGAYYQELTVIGTVFE